MNGYICFYKGIREEVYADSLYAARVAFEAKLKADHKVRKIDGLSVSVNLAELNGEPVVHVAVN